MNADINVSGKAIAVVIAFKGVFSLPAAMFLPWYLLPFLAVMALFMVFIALEAKEKETDFIRRWRNFMFRIKKKKNEVKLRRY